MQQLVGDLAARVRKLISVRVIGVSQVDYDDNKPQTMVAIV